MGKEGEMRRKREIVKKEKSGEYARKNWRKEGQWGSKRGEERVGNSKEGQEGKRKKAEGERERPLQRRDTPLLYCISIWFTHGPTVEALQLPHTDWLNARTPVKAQV